MKSAGERESVATTPTRWILVAATLLVLALGAFAVVKYPNEVTGLSLRLIARWRGPALPAGFTSGNGRIQATEYDIATKRPGRIATVDVREGDMVEAGQVLGRMDTRDLEADLREAEAQSAQAREDRRRALAAVVILAASSMHTAAQGQQGGAAQGGTETQGAAPPSGQPSAPAESGTKTFPMEDPNPGQEPQPPPQ